MRRLLWVVAPICAVTLLFVIGVSVDQTLVAPPNALVQVDASSRTFFAPPCRQISGALGLTTLANAKKLGFLPDTVCAESGGFVQRGQSLSEQVLEKFGLIAPKRSRWNANGSWNW